MLPVLNSSYNKRLNLNKKPAFAKATVDAVVSPRIELGYQVPETCVLSIVLRDLFSVQS